MSKRVLLTGVTSFTGCHIARAFVDAGFEVTATLSLTRDEYTDPLVQERLSHSRVTQFIENTKFGNENFLKTIYDWRPGVFINHGANIKGYRNPDFDKEKCLQESTQNLDAVLLGFSKLGTQFIHSGSVFERDQERGLEAYSPYGEAKSMIWQKMQAAAQKVQLPLSKIVIADPIGTFENKDRLAPLFFAKWKKGESVEVHNPDYIWDRVPAPWLAQRYVEAAQKAAPLIYSPSAFVESNLQWAQLLQKLFEDKSNVTCAEFTIKGEAIGKRINTQMCAELKDPAKVSEFFDDYATWLLKGS